MRWLVALAALAASLIAQPALARDYGQHGTVFNVMEPDLLLTIERKLKALEASGGIERMNQELARRSEAKVRRPEPVAGLTPAERLRSWSYDPSITMHKDIVDQKGNLIARRGQRVNPLDFVGVRQALVFVDGDNAAELQWALRTWSDTAAKIVFVSGSPFDAMKPWQRRFYFDQGGTLTSKFGIRHTPAVVSEAGSSLKISEIPLAPPAAAPGGGKSL